MPGAAPPGPLGTGENRPVLDRGTNVRAASPAARAGAAPTDEHAFEREIAALRAEVANAAFTGAVDGATRARYDVLIARYRDEIRARALAGRLTWAAAAREASEMRNEVMTLMRARTTPVGRAYAELLKLRGKTLNTLVAEKTVSLFGSGADFHRLSEVERNRVYAAVVESSGRSNARVNALMRRVSVAGRALLVASLAVAVYNVATADDKAAAAGREVSVVGGGIAGGIAGGALAGLACGPGAPVCVAVGAFVGGALAGLGADWMWSRR